MWLKMQIAKDRLRLALVGNGPLISVVRGLWYAIGVVITAALLALLIQAWLSPRPPLMIPAADPPSRSESPPSSRRTMERRSEPSRPASSPGFDPPNPVSRPAPSQF